MQSPELQTAGRLEDKTPLQQLQSLIPKVSRESSLKREISQRPRPSGEALCDWAARVPLKGTDSRKGARPQAKPPHARGLWYGCVLWLSSSPALAHQHAQDSAKTLSSKSLPLCPATGSSPQMGSRLPDHRSHCRFNSGSGERPLATVKLEGACARPVSCVRLAARKRAETAGPRHARQPSPSLPAARAEEGGPKPGNWEGAGLLSSCLV